MSGFRPSLKICIDNSKENDEASVASISGAEDGEISGSSSSSSSSSSSDSDSGSGSSSDSESENDHSRARTRKTADRPSKPQPPYSNKLTEKVMKQREERSKRFGIWHSQPKLKAEELDALYKTLGVTELDLKDNPRGIRLEAIHCRGVDGLSTEEVLDYFKAYAPGSLEWMDDSSCNIVWLDSRSAARAMINLSDDEEKVKTERAKRQEKSSIDKKTEEQKDSQVEDSNDIEMEDDDDLDLLGDDGVEVKPPEKVPTPPPDKPSEEKQMDTEDKADESETGSIADSEDELEFPPGRWRLGPPTEKTRGIFMRFAFKADKKSHGAERSSQYYQKYDNPRYGGVTGLISSSRKRKMELERNQEEMRGTKKPVRSHASRGATEDTPFDVHTRQLKGQQPLPNRAQPEVPVDDMFGDISSLETFAVDARAPKKKTKPATPDHASDEESEEGADMYPSFHDEEGEVSDDGIDMEKELEELLAPPAPKRYMRMYADDVEEQIKEKKAAPESASVFGHLDARAKIENRRREKKMGGGSRDDSVPHHGNDLRSRLGNRGRSRTDIEEEHESPQTFEKLTVQLYNE